MKKKDKLIVFLKYYNCNFSGDYISASYKKRITY